MFLVTHCQKMQQSLKAVRHVNYMEIDRQNFISLDWRLDLKGYEAKRAKVIVAHRWPNRVGVDFKLKASSCLIYICIQFLRRLDYVQFLFLFLWPVLPASGAHSQQKSAIYRGDQIILPFESPNDHIDVLNILRTRWPVSKGSREQFGDQTEKNCL